MIQINTGKECHLDAIKNLPLNKIEFLFIENVGNLICPAGSPLGVHKRIVVFSCTEGPYTVVKHPYIFKEADIVVINKIDLAKITKVSLNKLKKIFKKLNPLFLLWKLLLKMVKGR